MRAQTEMDGTLPRMGQALFAFAVMATLLLSGCASTGVAVQNADADQQLAPVQGGNVSTQALPPIGPNGEVQGPTDTTGQQNGMTPAQPNGAQTQVATNDNSIATVPPVGGLPNSAGRDLSGGLTIEKLLGRWTIVSGGDQCPINLTQTQKGSTGRYRASAPACALKVLGTVASWQLAGTQVQLFDEKGNLIGALILSGNRFIGTLSGGQGISMVG
jgi:protease inhibitor Inh